MACHDVKFRFELYGCIIEVIFDKFTFNENNFNIEILSFLAISIFNKHPWPSRVNIPIGLQYLPYFENP